MKKKVLLIFNFLIASFVSISQNVDVKNFYDFKSKTIDGKEFNFSDLRGKKVLIVNTASQCGYTPQYAELEELFEKYKNENFIIIGFPANNFGEQEPGTNKEIAEFCQKNFGVSFLMMNKISVKGADIDPLYQWLTQKSLNGVMDVEVTWNFQKFMIDEKGKLINFVSPQESPLSEKITKWIKS